MDSAQLGEGTVLRDRFTILRVIGQGAYGVVYLAGDLQVKDALWAVKEIREGSLDEDERREAVELFEKEASLLTSLNHTGVPKVIAIFSRGARHYMVMEYIEGETLRERTEKGKPGVREVVGWAEQVAGILAYLHAQDPPVIFRDLKPGNIMVTPRGRAILIDFGIARLFNPVKIKDTHIMGTPGYSPPEQYGKGQSDRRSDIYALGATVYHLLSGEDLARFAFDVPPLSQFSREVPPLLEQIVMKCLQKDPAARYQNAGSLASDLKSLPAPSAAAPASVPAQASPAASPQPPAPRRSLAREALKRPLECLWVLLLLSLGILFINPHLGCGIFLLELLSCVVLLFSLLSLPLYAVQRKWDRALVSLVSLLVIAMFLLPNFLRARPSGMLTACKSNLKNIGTALEMYSIDNFGRYPPSLDYLTPDYLKVLPTCPSIQQGVIPRVVDNLSPELSRKWGYRPEYRYVRRENPDCYTAWCQGDVHEHIQEVPNYPQYDSFQGLIEP